MKKRVVIIRSNPVNPDSRVEKEANSLIKEGHDVKILSWDRGNKYKVKESELNLPSGKVKIYRVGIPAEYGAGIKNLKGFLLFQIKIFIWLVKNRKNYEIIHACDFDTAYTAYHCARILKKKLVFDIFDFLFTDTGGKYSFIKNTIRYLQRKIINYADGTIICTEKRKEQIKGSNPRKLVIIHNSPPKVSENLKEMDLNKEKVKIVYVGILQDKRFLIELAEVIKELNNVELHIGGFGKYEKYFEEMSKEVLNIFYYGKSPYEKTLELENSCDIMTAIYDPSFGNHYFAAPNKFYESLMLGKPIIMVRNTGMSEVVLENEIGEVIEFDKQSLIEGIKNLIDQKDTWPQISTRMKLLYEQNYSWAEMEKRLIEFYRSI